MTNAEIWMSVQVILHLQLGSESQPLSEVLIKWNTMRPLRSTPLIPDPSIAIVKQSIEERAQASWSWWDEERAQVSQYTWAFARIFFQIWDLFLSPGIPLDGLQGLGGGWVLFFSGFSPSPAVVPVTFASCRIPKNQCFSACYSIFIWTHWVSDTFQGKPD